MYLGRLNQTIPCKLNGISCLFLFTTLIMKCLWELMLYKRRLIIQGMAKREPNILEYCY